MRSDVPNQLHTDALYRHNIVGIGNCFRTFDHSYRQDIFVDEVASFDGLGRPITKDGGKPPPTSMAPRRITKGIRDTTGRLGGMHMMYNDTQRVVISSPRPFINRAGADTNWRGNAAWRAEKQGCVVS